MAHARRWSPRRVLLAVVALVPLSSLRGARAEITLERVDDRLVFGNGTVQVTYRLDSGYWGCRAIGGEVDLLADASAEVVLAGGQVLSTAAAGVDRSFILEDVSDALGRGKRLDIAHVDAAGVDLILGLVLYEEGADVLLDVRLVNGGVAALHVETVKHVGAPRDRPAHLPYLAASGAGQRVLTNGYDSWDSGRTRVSPVGGGLTHSFYDLAVQTADRSGALVAGFVTNRRSFNHLGVQPCRGDLCFGTESEFDGIEVGPGGTLASDLLLLSFLPGTPGDHDVLAALEEYASAAGAMSGYVARGPGFVRELSGFVGYNDEFRPPSPRDAPEFWVGVIRAFWDAFGARGLLHFGHAYPSVNGSGAPDLLDGILDVLAANSGLSLRIWTIPFLLLPSAHCQYPGVPCDGEEVDPSRDRFADWFWRDAAGQPVENSLYAPSYYTLDLSHPEVLEFLRRWYDHYGSLAAPNVEGGVSRISYVMLDFSRWAVRSRYFEDPQVTPGEHDRRFDPNMTEAQILRAAYETIRDAARGDGGEETFILGCGMPLGPAMGVVDVQRIGGDVGGWVDPHDTLPAIAQAAAGRFYFHNRTWVNDPDTVVVREGLEDYVARTSASLTALSGGQVHLGDFPRTLPDDSLEVQRSAVLKKLMPPYGVAARPVDLFEDGHVLLLDGDPNRGLNPPRVWDLAISRPDLSDEAARGWHVVGVFNWNDDDLAPDDHAVVTVSFERHLQMARGTDCVVYDFWEGEPYAGGVHRDEVRVGLDGLRSKVLAIRPLVDRPQLVSTDFNVSQGGVDLLAVAWDGDEQVLSGSSQALPAEPYALAVHVPGGFAPGEYGVDSDPAARLTRDGDVVRLEFVVGPDASADWWVAFRRSCTVDADCGAGTACSERRCNAEHWCESVALSGPCDDGNACTVGDACAGGACEPGSSLECDDGNVCTDDRCDPAAGCVFADNAVPCDDGEACTTGDRCADGVCAGTATACDGDGGEARQGGAGCACAVAARGAAGAWATIAALLAAAAWCPRRTRGDRGSPAPWKIASRRGDRGCLDPAALRRKTTMNRMGWILLAGLLAGCGSAAVPADDAAAPPDDGIVEDAATAEDAGGEPEDSSGPDGCGSPDGGRPEVGAVRVATWRGGAPAAGSLTFDDTDPSHLPYGVPLLEERGLVGTFYLIVSSVSPDEWADWLPLLDRGHEIGSHTCNHGHLAEVDHGDVVREIVWSKNMLEWVTGRPVLTLGYPYSNENAWVRRAVGTYYVAARSGPEGDLSVNPPRPADIHRLRSFIPLGDGDLGAMLADVDEAMETGGWMILMIHGIEDLGYCCHTSRDVFGTVFDAMVEAGMWIGTVADVSRYLLERDAASVRWEAVAPDRVRVVLSVAPLPCEHCTIPLTVEVVLPDGWEDARVAGAEPGSWIVVETGEGRVLRFEMRAPESTAEVVQVCPDGGDDGDGGEDADRDRGEVGDDAGWGDDAPGDDGTDATEESSLSGTIRLDGSVVCGAEAHSDCAGSVAVAAFPCPELGMCPPIKVAPVDRSDLSAGPVDYRVARLPSDVEFWVLAVLLEDEEGRAVRMPMGGDLVSSDGVLASVTIPRGETATLDLSLRRLE